MKYLLFLLYIAWGCQPQQPSTPSASIPLAKEGDTLRLRLGQHFRLSASSNSCCLSCWIRQGQGLEGFPALSWLSYQHQTQDQADADCAGCTSTSWAVYQVKAPVFDSLELITIPMGVFEHAGIQCPELQAEHLAQGQRRVFYFEIN